MYCVTASVICKRKSWQPVHTKAGLLVSPKEVTVLGGVDADDQSSLDSSAQVPVSASSSQPSFVTSEQFEAMNDRWREQFARFEALLSRGNVFTIPKPVVSSPPSHSVISSQPFIIPAARHTGPVVSPAVQEDWLRQVKPKQRRKSKSLLRTKVCRFLCLRTLFLLSLFNILLVLEIMMICRNRFSVGSVCYCCTRSGFSLYRFRRSFHWCYRQG